MDLGPEPTDLPGQRDQGGTARHTRRSTGQPEPLGSHGSARRCSRGEEAPAPTSPPRDPRSLLDAWMGLESRGKSLGEGENQTRLAGGCTRADREAEMNSLSAAQRGFSKSRELVEPNSEISPHPSLPPSAIPAPGSHSRQGICCWSCAAAPLFLSHTHTEGTAAPRPPSERLRHGNGTGRKNPTCPASAALPRCFSK